MKILWIAILAGLVLVLMPGQNADAKVDIVEECEIEDDKLILRGSFTAELESCVLTFVASGGNQLEIDLYGGDVATAIRLAEAIAAVKPSLFIKGNCNSSCANYLIPVARRIVLGPRSLVITHGSPADFSGVELERRVTEFVRNATETRALPEDKQAQLVQQGLEQVRGAAKRHEEFVRKHEVPSGYFGGGATVVWSASELQSCFPNIEIEQPVIDRRGSEKDLRKAVGAGYVYGIGNVLCRV